MATVPPPPAARRRGRLSAVVVAMALLAALTTASTAQEFSGDDGPLPSVVFLATADNFPDALAASAVAGSIGGVVLLTGAAQLDPAAAAALGALAPDLVVLAGGTAVLDQQVEDDVSALGLSVRRVAGDSRVLTATALADFAQELGYGRPVVTGRSLDAGTIPGLDASTIQGLTPEELGGDVEGPIGPPGPAGPPGQDATGDPNAFMPDVILTDSGAAVPMPDESTQCITEPYTPDIDRIAVAQIGLSGRNDAAGSITLFARFLISEDDGMTWEQVSARISPENQITETAQGAISYTDVATLTAGTTYRFAVRAFGGLASGRCNIVITASAGSGDQITSDSFTSLSAGDVGNGG